MFKKAEAKAAAETAVPEITLAACSGTSAVVLVGDRVRFIYAMNVGLPATVLDLPAPPGGSVVSLGNNGPSAVTADGALWTWTSVCWERIANAHEVTA